MPVYDEKQNIMINEHKLKNVSRKRIYFNNDLIDERKEMQRKIRIKAKEGKEKRSEMEVR